MTAENSDHQLARRHLLRGGAVLAGTAGIAALGAVTAAPASAADGSSVLQGVENTATSTTALRIDEPGGGPDAALELGNDNGPSLQLQALSDEWEGSLDMGEIANTTAGPLIGVNGFGNNLTTGYLATNYDLARIPFPYAITPARVLDTRSPEGRQGIVRSSADALDPKGRLRAKAWIDVAIDPADENFTLQAVFVNLTAVAPSVGGYLTAYAPGVTPNTSTLNVPADRTVANGAFVAVGVVGTTFAVRVYSSTTTHVVMDLSGVVISDVPGPVASPVVQKAASKNLRRRGSRQQVRVLGRGRR